MTTIEAERAEIAQTIVLRVLDSFCV